MGHASLSVSYQVMSVFIFAENTQWFCYTVRRRTMLTPPVQYKQECTEDKDHSNGNVFSQ